jgi:hypothetical protein
MVHGLPLLLLLIGGQCLYAANGLFFVGNDPLTILHLLSRSLVFTI